MSDYKNKPMTEAPGRNWPVPEETSDNIDLGKLTIANNVYAVIAHEAASRVPGVVELSGTIVDEIAGMIGKRTNDRGVRVAVESEHDVAIDLTAVLEYGVRIPEVCVKLQVEVLRSIEEITGNRVRAVNIVVQSVRRAVKDKNS
jgi:uncharacterized alkaline shock family protein YloU